MCGLTHLFFVLQPFLCIPDYLRLDERNKEGVTMHCAIKDIIGPPESKSFYVEHFF